MVDGRAQSPATTYFYQKDMIASWRLHLLGRGPFFGKDLGRCLFPGSVWKGDVLFARKCCYTGRKWWSNGFSNGFRAIQIVLQLCISSRWATGNWQLKIPLMYACIDKFFSSNDVFHNLSFPSCCCFFLSAIEMRSRSPFTVCNHAFQTNYSSYLNSSPSILILIDGF